MTRIGEFGLGNPLDNVGCGQNRGSFIELERRNSELVESIVFYRTHGLTCLIERVPSLVILNSISIANSSDCELDV